MSSYTPKADVDGLKIICETSRDLPLNVQTNIFPFVSGCFSHDAKWLSTPEPNRLMSSDNLWCLATLNDEICASLYVERKLSDGGLICTTKSLVSNGKIRGIGKTLISISSTESMLATSLPISMQAFLRVLNGSHNVPSMMAFNNAGYFSMVPPIRVPIETLDVHLHHDEANKDGKFDVQRLDGNTKQILGHSTWLLKDWEKK
ncbi:MAG: hypothetical protein HWE33_15115 [Rhodobacteraceae bacterium]|nr:hypothetical protein [Paracoccaceae bacterium]